MSESLPFAAPIVALGYVRVSTDRQDLSVEAQTDALKRAAEYHKAGPLELFPEPDTSGSIKFIERPEGRRLIARLTEARNAGSKVTIIIPKVDRLGRNVMDIDQTVTLFEKLGARMIFLDLGVDTSTPLGRAMLQLTAVFAQLELARIRERIQTVLDHKRAGNELTGSLCYGWNVRYLFADGFELLRESSAICNEELDTMRRQHGAVMSRQLEDNAVEQKWILHMQHLRNVCAWSYNAIARDLNSRDVPTKRAGEILRLRSSSSSEIKIVKSRWQFGQVETILNNATVKAWLAKTPLQQAA